MTLRQPNEPPVIPTDLRDVIKALPKEEREAYEAAQRSIVEAQRHAQEHEGHRVIF